MTSSSDSIFAQPCRIWLLRLSVLGLLWTPAIWAQEQPPEKKAPDEADANPPVMFQQRAVRELLVTLLDENGQRAPGVTIRLFGQDRYELRPSTDEDAAQNGAKIAPDPWRVFTTDASGHCVVHFPLKEDPRSIENRAPGFGSYFLVAETKDGRRAVSQRILHGLNMKEASDYHSVSEWDAQGKDSWLFTNQLHELTLSLQTGRTISGVATTPEGKPLSGVVVSTEHDLHVDSHTGYGGEIFKLDATTDASGHFRIEHVYPVRCKIRAAGDEGSAWIRTHITVTTPKASTTQWMNQALEKIPDGEEDSNIELTIVIAPHAPTYRYFGRVTDAEGHPVAGLRIVAGVSHHAKPEDYADDHHFEYANTDAQGNWVLEASAPHVRFFDVKPDEKSPESLAWADFETTDLGLAEPGKYDFQVKSASAPKSQ